ncbi:MAG: hypothetical protein HN948_04615 [Clostridia bacterium]|nr:hypothetical protein [Clostridia bacterium]MBT7122273.1 hypothetical protein [Clostridia bacterium]
MKKFLLATFIVGVVIYLLNFQGFNFFIMVIFIVLLSITMFTLIYVNLLEDPEKQKARHARFRGISQNADNWSYNYAKKSLPVLIIFALLGFIYFFVSRMLEKVNGGLFAYARFTFIVGIILFVTMTTILTISLVKKKQPFASENIRRNAYMFLNVIVSLMLIAK